MQKDQQFRRVTGLTMLIKLILNYATLRFFTNTIAPTAATANITYTAIGVASSHLPKKIAPERAI